MIGDSHAQALWPRIARALRGVGHTVTMSLANPGWSEVKYLTSGLLAQIGSIRPDVVVLQLGGNNQSMSRANYEPAARKVLAAAGGARVVWIGPASAVASIDPGTSKRHETTAAMQGEIFPALGVQWFDSRPVTRDNHRSDGVHFDTVGYDRWAAAILPIVAGSGSGLPIAFRSAGISPWWFVGGAAVLALTALIRRRVIVTTHLSNVE